MSWLGHSQHKNHRCQKDGYLWLVDPDCRECRKLIGRLDMTVEELEAAFPARPEVPRNLQDRYTVFATSRGPG